MKAYAISKPYEQHINKLFPGFESNVAGVTRLNNRISGA
jgi:hypothetical protein